MRVNVYAEEMTDKVEIIGKDIDGHRFTGLRFHLALPATVDGKQYKGPFIHRPGDDDSSAVTFWGKRDLRDTLRQAIGLLDEHYAALAASIAIAPNIGSAWRGAGGIYAGVVRGDDGAPDYHLIVGEAAREKINWKDALAWAKDQRADGQADFELPKRKEQAILFGNVPELFAKEWYWSAEQSASDSDYAWFQYFDDGGQYGYHKSNELRARAVRRLPIQ